MWPDRASTSFASPVGADRPLPVAVCPAPQGDRTGAAVVGCEGLGQGRQIGGLTNSEGLMHSRFALLPAVVATIATLLLVGPAAAATLWTVYSRSGSGADAWT